MLRISRRDILHGYSMHRRHHSRDAGAKKNKMAQATQSLEVGLTALGMGFVAGKYPSASLGPIPIDLATALVAHGLGYTNVLKGAGSHAHNVGDGAFASYLVKVGAGLGAGMGLKNMTAGGENARRYGGMPVMNAGAAPLTEAELAAMAQAVR